MGKFLLGLVAALALGAGVYYFVLKDTEHEQTIEIEEAPVRGADLNLQANPIPEGAIMEDGTLD